MDITKLTGHTPGKWHYEQALRGDGTGIPYHWDIFEPTNPAPGCSESFRHVAETHNERIAALIAAAPDLLALAKMGLELAESVNEAWESDSWMSMSHKRKIVELSRALRAKAGE